MSRPDDIDLPKSEFNAREKLTILLIMFLISLLRPWKYNHEQKAFYDDVYTLIGFKERK
jgi:hypothetical protein